jgi:branched-chain amino acid transport system substrate-binding protein
MDRFSRTNLALLSLATATSLAFATPAAAQDSFKLGIVTFLSGPAADSFGVPARNGAQYVIDQLNKGSAPSPYEKVGFGGMKIEPVIIDENGGATKQVQELRNLYQRDNVDVVLGYIGSGDCLAVAPIAEELKKMLGACPGNGLGIERSEFGSGFLRGDKFLLSVRLRVL